VNRDRAMAFLLAFDCFLYLAHYQRCVDHAAAFRTRGRGGLLKASAEMPHSRCSFQAICIVKRRFLARISDAR